MVKQGLPPTRDRCSATPLIFLILLGTSAGPSEVGATHEPARCVYIAYVRASVVARGGKLMATFTLAGSLRSVVSPVCPGPKEEGSPLPASRN